MRTLLLPLAVLAVANFAAADEKTDNVSYYKQIRPIFQANCQGCHQPAKARGGPDGQGTRTDCERR